MPAAPQALVQLDSDSEPPVQRVYERKDAYLSINSGPLWGAGMRDPGSG